MRRSHTRHCKCPLHPVCIALALASAALPQLVYGETIPPYLWSKRFGDVSADSPQGLSVDGSGNVLYSGNFQGTVDFGGGGLTSAGAEDMFIAKFAPDGTHIWSKRFGSTGTDRARSVVADSAGNVYLAG